MRKLIFQLLNEPDKFIVERKGKMNLKWSGEINLSCTIWKLTPELAGK